MTNKKIIIIIAVLSALVLTWTWFDQNNYFRDENNNNSNVKEAITVDEEPSVQILSPANSAVMNPGPLVAQYVLSGETQAVQRVELELIKNGETLIIVSGSYNVLSKGGSQMVRTVDEGDYILRIRLVNQAGEYFESAGATSTSAFRVQSSYIGQ
ncbi:MAG: hypothetical protein WC693_00750 [Patescibacteria group bacterium]|jgi:hypothetical protein